MFTGLVQKTGRIRRLSSGAGLVIEVAFEPWPTPLEEGESVAVDGVCLTVAKTAPGRFTADVLDETAARTRLGGILPGERVNLERAVRAGEPLGGHLVQGHVDGVVEIAARFPRGRDTALRLRTGRVFAAQSVLKGSVAVDGVSLTVSALGDDWLEVNLIPTTAAETTLGEKRVGDKVNLETDVVGKYLARRAEGGLSFAKLAAAGFA